MWKRAATKLLKRDENPWGLSMSDKIHRELESVTQ